MLGKLLLNEKIRSGPSAVSFYAFYGLTSGPNVFPCSFLSCVIVAIAKSLKKYPYIVRAALSCQAVIHHRTISVLIYAPLIRIVMRSISNGFAISFCQRQSFAPCYRKASSGDQCNNTQRKYFVHAVNYAALRI